MRSENGIGRQGFRKRSLMSANSPGSSVGSLRRTEESTRSMQVHFYGCVGPLDPRALAALSAPVGATALRNASIVDRALMRSAAGDLLHALE